MPEPFLELVDISKSYPGVVALDHVGLQVSPGEVVALIGENGAGKSTLMRVLGGVVEPSGGVILVDGVARGSLTVADAIKAGIAFVHQELNLFDNLDVAGNVFIGREPVHGGPLRLIDRKRMHAGVAPLLERLGCDFAADAPLAELSLAQRQLVEIMKALSLDARLVIMDEPTSSLTLAETDRLMRTVASLKAHGVSVIFITHRLNEVMQCADRAVVLRDGRVVGALTRAELSPAAMIRLMIGRDLKSLYVPPAAPPGDSVLDIVDAVTDTYPGRAVSLSVRRGEILGLAGLVGSGRTELARALFGIDRLRGGAIRLDGEPIRIASPRAAIEQGIYLVPEDRKGAGLLLDVSITENISLPDLASYMRFWLVDSARENENAVRQRERLKIRAPDVKTVVGSLSGGNQQKVVLAKWLSMQPKVLIVDEPTRGVDVGAKQEIYGMLRRLTDAGVAILMISSDMEEVIGVSDRLAVMHEGAISGFLDRSQFSEHNVLQLAVGHTIAAEGP
ncbi:MULTISPECIES: sugar ABC transporter ATP-binding protein [Bradyrhizobium]|uniref:sugar ABC transporter ATP-binding protein n=1 Tax=Bradyrhizobium TaxID=374 RepID=UPI00155E92E8|nr:MULTISPECIES: sugar ABC transporter ATP-binding protein [Bradyrhizobium]MDD1518629.1 D-xylose ABC transporter ATP-binding protein [Bradyrhizobium sp. WBAH30]MDD1542427.1 D-xylose ABC transporter ATP-binding protein [Bradyrhizobium sp. WBAH41]MDD1556579.1 D-xylose ABC transporter ATP-binding protein [Bradyrhizobium sp. WBAH23]MDD1561580.1 D-xylose ABC transporter ATP-binding protein [Bradyrhizobium sp. WBAH33]MDD1589398.1 D-xylose ABC transporter ATP-binding protein [Bradyrhizobium sp. WBAH4